MYYGSSSNRHSFSLQFRLNTHTICGHQLKSQAKRWFKRCSIGRVHVCQCDVSSGENLLFTLSLSVSALSLLAKFEWRTHSVTKCRHCNADTTLHWGTRDLQNQFFYLHLDGKDTPLLIFLSFSAINQPLLFSRGAVFQSTILAIRWFRVSRPGWWGLFPSQVF